MSSIVVMKFGSSVLADESQLGAVSDEIYRALREGLRVVAVVSALGDTTDRLDSDYGDSSLSSEGYATFIGTGELRSAALLTRELGRAGITSTLADASRARLVTDGGILNAEPVGLDTLGLIRLLELHDVVVVPGFVGRDIHGRTTLLGRGGSDLTAVFVASRLDAPCILLKDVDGIFEQDPALSSQAVPRFEQLSWQTALEIGGAVVQRKALEYSAHHETSLIVRSLGGSGTLVGAFQDRLETLKGKSQKGALRVGLIGLGTVGSEVYERIRSTQELQLVAILVKDARKERTVTSSLLTDEPATFFGTACDLIVDCSNPSTDLNAKLLDALKRGIKVVTANKGNLADNLSDWAPWIKASDVGYSAAVGGVVPMLETVRKQSANGSVQSFRAVLNGTCNFILDRLHSGESFAEALATAQELGFAESDPTADIDGLDAARKCALLAYEAWGVVVDWREIELQGIAHLTEDDAKQAHRGGALLRLVAEGHFQDGEVSLSVKPEWVAKGSPEALVEGPNNVLTLQATEGRVVERRGAGAGGLATALSVYGDLLALTQDDDVGPGRFAANLLQVQHDDSNVKARQSSRGGRGSPRSLPR